MKDALTFENLAGGYGDTTIVENISGKVARGEVLGVFGRNGVGKTTLSRLLTGEIPASKGAIIYDGTDITSSKASARRKVGIGYLPQTGMVFDDLTVRDNLMLPKTRLDASVYFDHFPRLAERLDQAAGTMSGGERKILAFVRTMIEDTDLLVLDEPSEGVQPENIERMSTIITERAAEGAAVVLVEQNINFLYRTAVRFIGLDSGVEVFRGTKKGTNIDEIRALLHV